MKIYLDVLKKSGRLKKAVCLLFALSAVLFYFLVICLFSAQNGEESGSLSQEIAEEIARIVVAISNRTENDVFSLAEYFEHPLRKLAHFSEYAVLGGLFCGSFLPLMKDIRHEAERNEGRLFGKKRKRPGVSRSCGLYVKCTFLVMLMAAFDEMHQLFVPGRYASILDVLLDTTGCAVMCLILYLIFDRTGNGKKKVPFWKKKKNCLRRVK